MKKRVISCLLAVVLAAGLLAVPAAASGSSPASTDRADKLVALHLFRGTADGYKLDNTPTRMQGLVMLIRLLGKEEEALSRKEASPFTDLTWGFEHAGYAYAHGLTKGTCATTFTPNSPLSATGYVTFLLRALGYSDTEGDFAWGQQMAFANSIGMMDQAAVSKLPGLTLNRGDMVDLSYAALTCRMKGENVPWRKNCGMTAYSPPPRARLPVCWEAALAGPIPTSPTTTPRSAMRKRRLRPPRARWSPTC